MAATNENQMSVNTMEKNTLWSKHNEMCVSQNKKAHHTQVL